MSREGRLVVTAEIDCRQTEGMTPERAVKFIVNTVRAKADEECAREGARLRTDRLPDFDIKRGTLSALGLEFWLVYSNWHVDVPSNARIEEVRAP